MGVIFLAAWLMGAMGVGLIATIRERSGFGWFLFSLLLSPLLGLIIVLVLERPRAAVTVVAVEEATLQTHVHCPDCREMVRRDARKCKHCGSALVPQV